MCLLDDIDLLMHLQSFGFDLSVMGKHIKALFPYCRQLFIVVNKVCTVCTCIYFFVLTRWIERNL